MKNIIILFAVTFTQFFNVYGQNSELNMLFDRYQNTEGITSIKIAKPMFGLLSKLNINDAELSKLQPLLGKINSMKILIASKPESVEEMKKLNGFADVARDIGSTISKLNYNEIMAINNKDSKLKFLASEPKNGVMEDILLKIDNGNDKILMMLDGKMNVKDFNKLFEGNDSSSTNNSLLNSQLDASDSGIATNYLSGEVRNVGQFNGINASTGVKVVFTQSPTSNVKVIADADKLQYVITKVENGVLRIYIDNRDKKQVRFKNLSVNVANPRLTQLKASSGASFSATTPIEQKNISLDASSGGNIQGDFSIQQKTTVDVSSGANVNIKLSSKEVACSASSGSSLGLSGKSENLSLDISSGSMAKAPDFKSKNVTVEATSGSSASVYATDTLKVRASSGGSVKYHGNPSITSDVSKTSGGSLSPIN